MNNENTNYMNLQTRVEITFRFMILQIQKRNQIADGWTQNQDKPNHWNMNLRTRLHDFVSITEIVIKSNASIASAHFS